MLRSWGESRVGGSVTRVSPFGLSSNCRRAGARRCRVALALVAALASAAFASCAEGAAAPGQVAGGSEIPIAEQVEAHKQALTRATEAVLGVEATAVEDARSISTLGRMRQGSGVLIGDDGLVLTIGYLILEADHVDLVQGSGRRVPARVVSYDLASGFGLLQALAPLGLAPVPLGTSSAVADDEPLMVASGGDDGDLSLAHMVSRRPFSGYWEYHIDDALVTVPVRTDHSGAGLFNANGELVGIGSLVVGDASGGAGPAVRGNMFVPVDLLKPILTEMRTRGVLQRSARAWLGLNCVEYGGHVRVIRLAQESPAEEAGLQPGDLIVAIDGIEVADLASFYKTLWRGERAERDVTLEIRRGGETLRVQVHAVDRMQTMRRPQGV